MKLRSLLLTCLIATACHSAPNEGAHTSDTVPLDLSDWPTEHIAFPPGFAPDMPSGQEQLLFSPGWRTRGNEDTWSYVLLMEIAEPNMDAARITELFELYYDGLIGAVAQGKPFTIPEDPATVSIEPLGGNLYTGIIETYDSFNGGEPLTLHVKIEMDASQAGATVLRIQASPSSLTEGPIWGSLQQAIDSLSFE